MWPAHGTCPHLAFDTGYLAGLCQYPSKTVFHFAAKLVRRAKAQSSTKICYKRIDAPWQELVLVAYSDAGWATRPSGHSQAGVLATLAHPKTLAGFTATANLLEYASCKITLSVQSSYDAELHAMQIAAETVETLQSTLSELATWAHPRAGGHGPPPGGSHSRRPRDGQRPSL
jgi:hypothetical protein